MFIKTDCPYIFLLVSLHCLTIVLLKNAVANVYRQQCNFRNYEHYNQYTNKTILYCS